MNEIVIDSLHKQLREITIKIDKLKEILQDMEKIRRTYVNKSNLGWLLSMIANESGTLFAVITGIQASEWGDAAHKLEQQIVLLNIDKKFKEKEIEEASKTTR